MVPVASLSSLSSQHFSESDQTAPAHTASMPFEIAVAHVPAAPQTADSVLFLPVAPVHTLVDGTQVPDDTHIADVFKMDR